MKKRILSILTALCLCLSLLPTVALADTTPDWIGWTALAVDADGSVSTQLASGGKYYLADDLIMTSALTVSVGGGEGESPVTLDLNGHVLALADAGSVGSGRVIQITKTGSLTLQDSDSTTLHLFTPDKTGRWVLNETSGTKSVSGGIITGGTSGTAQSDGGGVKNEGIFTMNGGVIVGNSSYNGGGVKNEGTFTMTGGQIVGNAAVISAANTGGYGGGVYSHAGQDTPASFTMRGGRILDNTAVYGGGIHSSGTKNGSDPILATLTVQGSADIYHNHAKNGGGIYAEYTTAALNSSATVSRNTATSCGGGILVNAGSFTMRGGTISGNSVSCADGSGLGGGLFYSNNCTVIMVGGKITGNNADGKGGGVYCGSDNFTVSEGASVTDNVVGGTEGTDYQYYGGKDSNVYLRGSITITVSGSFYGTLGVTTEQTAGAYPSAVTIAAGAESTQAYNFTSDNGLYSVEKTYDKGVYVIQFVGKCTHKNLTETEGTYTCNNCSKPMVAKLTCGEGDGETTAYYSTLADAVLAAQTDGEAGTLALLTSLTDGGRIDNSIHVKGGSFTLDLNGHTVAFAADKHLVITGGSVTLTDSVGDGSSTGKISGSVQVKENGALTVSGGTVEKLSGNGTVIVGTPEVLAAAVNGGVSNIRLGSNIILTSPLTITGTVTLDLNGYVLQMTGSGSVLKVESGGNLTLKDSAPNTPHYFTVDSTTGLWTLSDDVTENVVTGGILTGGVYMGGTMYANGGIINDSVVNDGTITRSDDATDYTTFNGTVTNNGTIEDAAYLTVTFNGNGGSAVDDQKVLKGQKATKPDAPTRDGYTFGGWHTDEACNTAWKFDSDTVTENLTLYAKWTCAGHTGGTADCKNKAVCETCGEPYGEIDSSKHTGTLGDWQKDESGHWKVYDCCPTVKVSEGTHSYTDGVCECGAVQPSSGGGSSGGGSSGGGSNSSTPSISVPVSSDSGSVNVKAEVKKDNATVEVSDKQIESVIEDGAGNVELDVSGLKNVTSATVPSHVVEKTNEAENTGLTVALPAGSVTLDETALMSVAENANGKDVTVSVVSIPTADLSQTMKDIIGMEPTVAAVVDVNLYVNGQKQSSFDGGKLTIAIPYTPKSGEDTSKLTVWFITDDGRIENKGGYYDADKKCFVFETEHLSQYLLVSTDAPAFTDVPEDAYYADAVIWAVLNGITTGMTETTFGPDVSCTRAQIVTFLWRAAGEPEASAVENPFSDVTESDYFYSAVLWAVENGITTGVTDTTFAPNATCTRAQAAAFLYRNEQASGGGFTGNWMFQLPFTDVPDWCYEAVAWCYMNGVTQGTSATTFSPDGDCTRAQIVTMLYRLLGES